MNAQLLNIIGLILDILGVIGLFKYGLPADISREGDVYIIAENNNQEEKDKWKKFNRISRICLGSIILGFIAQIGSSVWQMGGL